MLDNKNNQGKHNDFTTNSNSLGQNWNDIINVPFYCEHLLPCGLCSRMDRPCPKFNTTTWDPNRVIWTTYHTSSSIGQSKSPIREDDNDDCSPI